MEQRLIDANALRAKCDAPHWCVWMSEIDDAPTVDAVEVVRCEKCVCWKMAKVNKKGFKICPASGMEITETDFCSYGERR